MTEVGPSAVWVARGRAVNGAGWTPGQLLLRFLLLPVTRVLLVGALMTGGSAAEALRPRETGCYAPRCLCFLSPVPWVAFLDVLIPGALCLRRLMRFCEGCRLPWGPGQCPRAELRTVAQAHHSKGLSQRCGEGKVAGQTAGMSFSLASALGQGQVPFGPQWSHLLTT